MQLECTHYCTGVSLCQTTAAAREVMEENARDLLLSSIGVLVQQKAVLLVGIQVQVFLSASKWYALQR